jgi:HPr kinase/phosphorylase
MPVATGRDVALLVEIAARNHLLKRRGYNAAKEMAARVHEEIARRSASDRERKRPPRRRRRAGDV